MKNIDISIRYKCQHYRNKTWSIAIVRENQIQPAYLHNYWLPVIYDNFQKFY